MKFGVVLCPNCKTAKGMVLGTKTTTCAKCQKTWKLNNANIVQRVDSESRLAFIVGEYNKKLGGGEEVCLEYLNASVENKKDIQNVKSEPQSLYDQIARGVENIRGKDEKFRFCAKELSENLGEFSQEDFYEVIKRVGYKRKEDPNRYIIWLLDNNVIYEPKVGRYKYIEE